MHEGIAVWMDEGDWYLEVRTVCRHLQPDNSCGIYETRPQVCRDYGVKDGEPCEFFTDELEYDLYFDSDEKFEAWYKAEQEKKEKRRRERARLRARRQRLLFSFLSCRRVPIAPSRTAIRSSRTA